MTVEIDANQIVDWHSFHLYFSELFGFPDFYGENMNAWIDCMGDIDAPQTGMITKNNIKRGETLILKILNYDDSKCKEQMRWLHRCVTFVNMRKLDAGSKTMIALAYYDYSI